MYYRFIVALCFVTVVVTTVHAEELKLLKTWTGVVRGGAIAKAPADGCIANEKDFKELWKVWQGNEEAPKIDFTKELVVVGKSRVGIIADVDGNGDLTIRTLPSNAKEFTYTIATISGTASRRSRA